MSEVETLLVTFDTKKTEAELPLLRGAMIHATEGRDVLLHNHIDRDFRYSYPLVQYKCIGGRAALLGVAEGVETVKALLTDYDVSVVRIGRRVANMAADDVEPQVTDVSLSDAEDYTYSIHKYFPFNQENYRLYCAIDSIVERYIFIEKCIVGNILSFAKGVGVHFEDKVKVTLTDVRASRLYQYKRVKLLGFDLTFKSNVLLPDHIGLGKDVSLGSGTIRRM